jgi:hypothetical protein
MPHTFTRQQLYDLVWAAPMRELGPKYNISDRGLAKACAAANVPVPERGYWARLHAGKKVFKRTLPPRGLGQSDEVTIGADPYRYYSQSDDDFLNQPVPPQPVFEKDLDEIRAQVTAMVGKAPAPRKKLETPHPLVAKVVEGDRARSQKEQSTWGPKPWNMPVFDTPFEARRLRILNALFACLEFCGMKPHISGKEGRDLSVVVGDTDVSFSLDAAGAEKQLERERNGYAFQARDPKARMRLSQSHWRSPANVRTWEDREGDRLENQLREIVIDLIVAGEQQHRNGVIGHREWFIERKSAAEEKERQRKIEEERKRKEHQAKVEKLRVDHLLAQAELMRQAAQIRLYVAAIQNADKTAPEPMSADELESWSRWALAQADRIDPIISGSYKTRPSEPTP